LQQKDFDNLKSQIATSSWVEDFIFQLTREESDNLLFQIGIASSGGRRTLPRAFSEQGVAMLSGVLHSERAIKVNIHISSKNWF